MTEKELLQKSVGQKIKYFREERNITQAKLADLCGFDRPNMARLEAGGTNPTLYTLKKIADKLEVTVCDLVKF